MISAIQMWHDQNQHNTRKVFDMDLFLFVFDGYGDLCTDGCVDDGGLSCVGNIHQNWKVFTTGLNIGSETHIHCKWQPALLS